MKLVEALLATKIRDFLIIKAHPAGPRRLFVAIEVFVHESKQAATAIVALDLDTLAVELVHEVAGSTIDYVHADGWHGVLQRDAVIELGGKRPFVTRVKLGRGRLAGLARLGGATIVAGTKMHGAYASDGFVARVEGKKLAMLLETSKLGTLGQVEVLCAGAKHLYAGGGWVDDACAVFRGDGKAFGPGVAISPVAIRSLHETAGGAVMVGCREGAALYVHGKPPQLLTGSAMPIEGVTEFRGVEYWMSTDGHDQVVLWKRAKTKLVKAWKAKARWAGYRNLDGAPNGRMTASADLLVVSNVDRLHVYDGKTWSHLALQPKTDALFKHLPVGMKR